MNITQEHISLFKLATTGRSTDSLVTRVLQLKVERKTHREIAENLGISSSYVNHIITQTRKAFNSVN